MGCLGLKAMGTLSDPASAFKSYLFSQVPGGGQQPGQCIKKHFFKIREVLGNVTGDGSLLIKWLGTEKHPNSVMVKATGQRIHSQT